MNSLWLLDGGSPTRTAMNRCSGNEFEVWQQEELSQRQSVPMLREEAPAAAEGVAIPKIVILD
jgi:hypothetical protein